MIRQKQMAAWRSCSSRAPALAGVSLDTPGSPPTGCATTVWWFPPAVSLQAVPYCFVGYVFGVGRGWGRRWQYIIYPGRVVPCTTDVTRKKIYMMPEHKAWTQLSKHWILHLNEHLGLGNQARPTHILGHAHTHGHHNSIQEPGENWPGEGWPASKLLTPETSSAITSGSDF